MEEVLFLEEEREEKKESMRWGVLIGEEMKRLGYLAGPMVAVTLSQYLLQILDPPLPSTRLELERQNSEASICLMLARCSSGMASALETLSGQAYGAQQYKRIGTQTYTAIFSLIIVCIPLSVLWIFLGKILVFVGQDTQISYEAGKYAMWLVPALFGYATLQPLIRYFQIDPSHAHKLLHHNLFPHSCLLGLLPNPQLETSVLSVCSDSSFLAMNSLNTLSTLYAIPYGLGAAASTRISNELGAGNPQGARVSAISLMPIAAVEAITVSTIIFVSRHVVGCIFSNEEEVVDYVTTMAPLLCLSTIMDSIQGTLSGVTTGCGWQHIGAYINLAAFYLFGIPIAVALGFWLNFRGKAKASERLFKEKSSAEEAFILRE
ncbi:unnamed protein product [Fraxinus pennsylvanica]|uniref:Protein DETOXIFICATION n=1 Tax=Fraxinus pennsylvanica TaxID=56036 RepID=A0AAD2ABY9_9LAMI|nr:unnamed protein product [Fraxinus pennsylvanica]